MIDEKIRIIKELIVDMSEHYFHVRKESDSAGTHFVAYLVEGDVDLKNFRARLRTLRLDKKTLIVLKDEDFIKAKIKEDNETLYANLQ